MLRLSSRVDGHLMHCADMHVSCTALDAHPAQCMSCVTLFEPSLGMVVLSSKPSSHYIVELYHSCCRDIKWTSYGWPLSSPPSIFTSPSLFACHTSCYPSIVQIKITCAALNETTTVPHFSQGLSADLPHSGILSMGFNCHYSTIYPGILSGNANDIVDSAATLPLPQLPAGSRSSLGLGQQPPHAPGTAPFYTEHDLEVLGKHYMTPPPPYSELKPKTIIGEPKSASHAYYHSPPLQRGFDLSRHDDASSPFAGTREEPSVQQVGVTVLSAQLMIYSQCLH